MNDVAAARVQDGAVSALPLWGEASLGEIRRGLAEAAASAAALRELGEVWRSAAAAAQRVPGVCVEDGGECLYLHALSPGCRACKRGEWDCIFVTMQCNLDCAFCWRPCEPRGSHCGSALADDRDDLTEAWAAAAISGISFSGGEALLEPERVFAWAEWVHARMPACYCWLYTNGVAVTDEQLIRLAAAGVHEVRFNLAAAGYRNPDVLRAMRFAAHCFAAVTVEIPAIPEDADEVLASLAAWSEAGTRYLNLHELVFEPGTNSGRMAGPRCMGGLGDGHAFEYHPASRTLTLAVMERVAREGLPLGVNDCSLHSKLRQLRGRRRTLSAVLRREWEKPAGDDRLETCGLPAGPVMRLFHPDRLADMRAAHPDVPLVRLLRTVPLHAAEPPRWCGCDAL